MKNFAVMTFAFLALMFAGLAEAASPKRPPRPNQSRIGPYATGNVGMTSYTSDEARNEALLESFMTLGNPSQDLQSSTDDTNIGYNASFGYRFHRFFAFELGLVQYGDLVTSASGNVDYPDLPGGFIPATSELKFWLNGILISAVGVLPIKDKIELFGRVGYMFSTHRQEFASKADGETIVTGSFREDEQDLVYGVGLGWNLSQGYSIRAEYQIIQGLGAGAGAEDLDSLSLGLQIRF